MVLGTLGAMVNGSMFPLFALFFGEVLEVFSLPSEQVFGEIHLWAGLFLLLGVVSFFAQFAKVRQTVTSILVPCIICSSMQETSFGH